ncbi:MAG: hypothetical protein KF712_06770 [Akkermansiaceae bacterium]|nr:hypothetical protein [Akkermansiaceae bacterium]
MRLLLNPLILALGMSQLHAAPLSEADREALIERLDMLKKSATERLDARFQAGVQAYAAAMNSEDDALALYLKCVEKVDFIDQKKKESDFREWKRKEGDKLSAPSFKLALRHQLYWLSLTCQAASENADRERLTTIAQSAMDAVFRDLPNLKDQQQVLKQSVTGTVFAKAYEITNIKVDKWALSPVDIQIIYEQMVMPPLRNSAGIDKLKEAWVRRMQQEGAVVEYWTGRAAGAGGGRQREEGRIGMADNARPPEVDRFLNDVLPVMQWQMELDLFKAGDQAAAAVRMINHIEKNLGNSSAKDWSEQFRNLLMAGAPAEQP